jgi:acyl dehydratase
MTTLRHDDPVGTTLEPVSRKFEVAMFGAGGLKTIHNDVEAARREGLPGPIAVGPQVAALAFRMLRMAFGEGWFQGGGANLTFRRPIPSDAYCTAHGVVTGRETLADGSVRLICDVWVETEAGVRAIVGSGSGVLSPAR